MDNPKYPIYIISKGRWESRLTAKALEKRKIPYHIVVEPQEYEEYSNVIDKSKILVLPFSNLGQGSIPARNWVWEDSIKKGYKRHWILDDNISKFYRYNNNNTYETDSGITFLIIENFVDRYKNIAQAGMQYYMFVKKKNNKQKAILFNTRIYSIILNLNELPYRWRGRYNEDTDLSIRILKDGWCTALFYAFPAKKEATMTMKGGNTEELYQGNGRYLMALSLKKQHPEIVKIKKKWGRWQHEVDYRSFKYNKLVKEDNIKLENKTNEYGMNLVNNI